MWVLIDGLSTALLCSDGVHNLPEYERWRMQTTNSSCDHGTLPVTFSLDSVSNFLIADVVHCMCSKTIT